MDNRDAVRANRANWDERVPSHLHAYDVDGFVADPARISSVVREDLALMAAHLPGVPLGCAAPARSSPQRVRPSGGASPTALDLLAHRHQARRQPAETR